MRFLVVIVTMLVLSTSASAECREKECMPNERVITEEDQSGGNAISGSRIYFDNVFEIGTNWFIIFEYGESHSNGLLEFDFGNGVIKNITLFSFEQEQGTSEVELYGIVADSVSFSGSTFVNEEPHKRMYVNFSKEDGPRWSVELDIFVNKPPANDLFYLWGGMTVFWASIGAYVLYISSKFTQLREK